MTDRASSSAEGTRSSSSIPSRVLDIQVASDLHIEFFSDNDWDSKKLIDPKCNVLALVGDIGVVTDPEKYFQYESFLSWCCEKFERVLVITGNHEYYNGGRKKNIVDIEMCNVLIERLEEKYPRLTFMNQKMVEINGVVILGTTLWSEVPNKDAESELEGFLNDYRLIYRRVGEGSKPVSAADTNRMYEEQLEWLTGKLDQVSQQDSDVPVVVLTHYTPSMTGTSDPRYESNPLPAGYRNCGFSSPLDHLFEKYPSIRCWCYGHTHFNNQQIRSNDSLLVSNQRGYKDCPNKNYRPNFVIRLGENSAAVLNYE